ncbi:MAG: SpoIIE family protein phosphatase, partial [Actinobacteria bacterium]|nr:SpoIIE family protein phosphatase [Actinomycetota bacterium]
GGQWTRRTESLHIGDVLFVWSDGLVESHDAEGVELGDAGLNRLIDAAMQEGSTPSEIVAHVLAAARGRAVDWRRDDVTLAAVARD